VKKHSYLHDSGKASTHAPGENTIYFSVAAGFFRLQEE
jgi:hypothetical protein